MGGKKILFIGDSLIAFFDWQSRFPAHEISNLGVAGETVEGLLFRTGRVIERCRQLDLIVVMTGINNVAMEDFAFLGSYKKILANFSSSYPGARLIVHSLLPTLIPWISDSSIRRMNSHLRQMAGETGIEYFDLYAKFTDREGAPVKDYYLSDGVHLSDKGYAAWADVLAPLLDG